MRKLAQRPASCSNTPMHVLRAIIPAKWRQHLTLDLPDTQVGCIWVHACSVGEVASVAPLIRALQQRGHRVHLSVITATGFGHAQQLFGRDIGLSFLAWDFPGLMARMIGALQPSLLLLAETEFWPGMLANCQTRQIPIIGINTRISDRSLPRYQASRWLWKRWLAPVSLFLAQSETDGQRLISMGVSPDKIQISGNLKYAISPPAVDTAALRQQLDQSGSRPILLIASTHDGEDARLLDMWPSWHATCPDLLTLIVPRHPQRFEQVATLIRERGHALARWSLQTSAQHNNQNQTNNSAPDIVLIDSMGVLADLYSIADAVIIAGSLENIGGHNPLEAAICGRGVVCGPNVQNFRSIMADMQKAESAILCQNDDELQAAIGRLLSHPNELQQLNASAALFIQKRAHVLDHMLADIQPYLPRQHIPDV